jgi:hypothetical protein
MTMIQFSDPGQKRSYLRSSMALSNRRLLPFDYAQGRLVLRSLAKTVANLVLSGSEEPVFLS